MRCPVSFFDVTPVGRILQRFSKDMDELDVRIPYYLEYVAQGMLLCIGQMLMVCIMYPVFSVVLAIAIAIFGFLEVRLKPLSPGFCKCRPARHALERVCLPSPLQALCAFKSTN